MCTYLGFKIKLLNNIGISVKTKTITKIQLNNYLEKIHIYCRSSGFINNYGQKKQICIVIFTETRKGLLLISTLYNIKY